MKDHHPNCHHKTPPKPGEPTCRCFCTCPEMKRPQSTPNTQGDTWRDEFLNFWVKWRFDWLAIEQHSNENQENYARKQMEAYIQTLLSKERAEGERRGAERAVDCIEKGVEKFSTLGGNDWRGLLNKARTLPTDSTEDYHVVKIRNGCWEVHNAKGETVSQHSMRKGAEKAVAMFTTPDSREETTNPNKD